MSRLSKYKPEFCEMLVEHMTLGYSFESFAADANVNQDTLINWSKNHPEFMEAKRLGYSKCLKFWEKIGIAGVLGKVPNFNATTYIFNMKNRFRWTDRTDLRIDLETTKYDKDFALLRSVPRKELIALAKAERPIKIAKKVESEKNDGKK